MASAVSLLLVAHEPLELDSVGDLDGVPVGALEQQLVVRREEPIVTERFGDGRGVVVVERLTTEEPGVVEKLVEAGDVLGERTLKVVSLQQRQDLAVENHVVRDARERRVRLCAHFLLNAGQRQEERVALLGERGGHRRQHILSRRSLGLERRREFVTRGQEVSLKRLVLLAERRVDKQGRGRLCRSQILVVGQDHHDVARGDLPSLLVNDLALGGTVGEDVVRAAIRLAEVQERPGERGLHGAVRRIN